MSNATQGGPGGHGQQPWGGAPQQPMGAPQQPMGAPQQPMGAPQQPMGAPQQPMGGMVPAHQHGMQGPAGMAPGGVTAFGVPLNPGERVVYAHVPNYTMEKVMMWIFGVLTAVFLIGLYFIYLAINYEKRNPKAQLVTTQRIIVVPGEGQPESHWLQNVVDVEPVRQKVSGGRGLLGAAISAGVSAVANKMADKKAKTTPGYWTRAIAIILIEHTGARHQLACRDAKNMGLFLAQGMMSGGFDNAPSVPVQP